jgi:serine phosphatase RsbU (regulator of sigma subunit)
MVCRSQQPLYVVKGSKEQGQEGDSEAFFEVKPTKAAIGGFTSEIQVFETHELSLQQGDAIYLFSDGYADQFGGPAGKKMMTRKFRETLLAISPLSLREQQSRLEDHFDQWKGGHEQVDDVLVIGIRL